MSADSPELAEANRRAYEHWREQYQSADGCRAAAAKDASEAAKRLAVAVDGILAQAPELAELIGRLLDGAMLSDQDRNSYAHRPDLAPILERAAARFESERLAWLRVIRRAELLEAGGLVGASPVDALLFADEHPRAVSPVERRTL